MERKNQPAQAPTPIEFPKQWLFTEDTEKFAGQLAQFLKLHAEERNSKLRLLDSERCRVFQDCLSELERVFEDDEDTTIEVIPNEFTGGAGINVKSTYIILSKKLGEIEAVCRVLQNCSGVEISPIDEDVFEISFGFPSFWREGKI